MTDRNDKLWIEWVIGAYDKFVADHPDDGSPLEDSRDAIAAAYTKAVDSGDTRWTLDLLAEGRLLFDRAVKPVRSGRRGSLVGDGKYLLSALNDETILGPNDPQLGQAYPLGMKDGRDKTLRHWTQEDWQQASLARYRNAAEVTKAAQEFDVEVSAEFIKAMRARGVAMTGELFEHGDDL